MKKSVQKEPVTSEETNLSQPVTSEETNLSQPMTSGETSLRQPVTSRESNDEMYYVCNNDIIIGKSRMMDINQHIVSMCHILLSYRKSYYYGWESVSWA